MTNEAITGGQDRLQQAASDVASRTSETVANRVDDEMSGQLQRAGDLLGSVAHVLRESGDQIRGQQPQVASVADTAASQVERVAAHVRESRPRDIVDDVERFARQQPAVFLGGALLVGALAARLLKASPPAGNGMRAGYGRSPYRYDPTTYGAAGSMTRETGDGGF
jgi:hypothetical protein